MIYRSLSGFLVLLSLSVSEWGTAMSVMAGGQETIRSGEPGREQVAVMRSAAGIPVLLSELMFDPLTGGDMEFLEFHNPSRVDSLLLGGMAFTAGIEYVIPKGMILGPGAYLLIVCDPSPNFSAFRNHYGLGTDVMILGPYTGKLSNAGETVTLSQSLTGDVVVSLAYVDDRGWPRAAFGPGHSLVPLAGADQADGALEYCGFWRASAFIDGSPGQADPTPSPGLILNEIMANTDSDDPDRSSNDWVELYNPSDVTIAFSGYFLSDKGSDLFQWAVPSGSLGPGRRMVFDEVSGFRQNPETGWAFSRLGETA